MRKSKAVYFLGAAVGAWLVPGRSSAADTITYTYDALGRLVAVSTSGGVNNGLAVGTGYDPAGNRTSYTVTGASGPPPPPPPSPPPPGPPPPPPPPPSPPPPPPPPPGNQPPVAVDDAGSMTKCASKSFAVLANDYDPDGNTPLALVSVSGGGTRGTPSISGTNILFIPSGTVAGTATVNYVMRDALGATASATLTITISNGTCGGGNQ